MLCVVNLVRFMIICMVVEWWLVVVFKEGFYYVYDVGLVEVK